MVFVVQFQPINDITPVCNLRKINFLFFPKGNRYVKILPSKEEITMNQKVIQITTIAFLCYDFVFSYSVLAHQNFSATVSSLENLKVKQIFRIAPTKNTSTLVAEILKIIVPTKPPLPQIQISLGTISLEKLQKSLKSKKIDTSYYERQCKNANFINKNKYHFSSTLYNNFKASKFYVSEKIYNDSLGLIAKTPSRDTNTRDCESIKINPSAILSTKKEYILIIEKEGYHYSYLPFQVISTNNTNNSIPLLKFSAANVKLKDKILIESIEFILEINSSDSGLREKISSEILSKDSRLRLSFFKSIKVFNSPDNQQGMPDGRSVKYVIKVSDLFHRLPPTSSPSDDPFPNIIE
jgi:hypothetical protein